MANKVNNWEELLKLANEDLKKYDVEIGVYDHDGEYSVTIVVDGKEEEYADNYYEDELGNLINDAWAHARAKVAPQIAYRVSAYKTGIERLMLAVASLRSARASKKEFPKGSDSYCYWDAQARFRKEYVKSLEKIYKIKYYQL